MLVATYSVWFGALRRHFLITWLYLPACRVPGIPHEEFEQSLSRPGFIPHNTNESPQRAMFTRCLMAHTCVIVFDFQGSSFQKWWNWEACPVSWWVMQWGLEPHPGFRWCLLPAMLTCLTRLVLPGQVLPKADRGTGRRFTLAHQVPGHHHQYWQVHLTLMTHTFIEHPLCCQARGSQYWARQSPHLWAHKL